MCRVVARHEQRVLARRAARRRWSSSCSFGAELRRDDATRSVANEPPNQENDTARLDERNRAEMIMYVGAHGTTTEPEP